MVSELGQKVYSKKLNYVAAQFRGAEALVEGQCQRPRTIARRHA